LNKKHTPSYGRVCNGILLESEGLQKEKTTDPKTERFGAYTFAKIIFGEK
jgi:hypothetical protein